jgi:ABC-type dipeptide/oligopeptide/nickel transport system permease component
MSIVLFIVMFPFGTWAAFRGKFWPLAAMCFVFLVFVEPDFWIPDLLLSLLMAHTLTTPARTEREQQEMRVRVEQRKAEYQKHVAESENPQDWLAWNAQDFRAFVKQLGENRAS